MTGETDLTTLLKTLSAELVEGVFVFVCVPVGTQLKNIMPRMIFREREGITLILLMEEAEAHGLDYEFPSRMITLNVHSSLEAVGFIAKISAELTKENMGVNPVAGFYHDHLFVPDGREQDALRVLKQISNAER